MAQINPYLNFNGTCRQAMTFYKECLGGDLNLMTAGESPMAGQIPTDYKDQIMHSVLTANGITIMASDNINHSQITEGNNIHLCINCKSKEEIQDLYNKLSAGGKISMPLKEEFFGWFSQFTDKFGINWMLQFGENKK